MTVSRFHEYYLLDGPEDMLRIPRYPEEIVIPANRFLPDTEALTFAVWESPEVSGGQALATAEAIINEFPTGKPVDLIQDKELFRRWVDSVTEIYTRKVDLNANNVGRALVVDVGEAGETARGFLPKYISKIQFLNKWEVVQVFKLKYGDMEVPDSFEFPSSRPPSEDMFEGLKE